MTLDPVFRSMKAVDSIRELGLIDKMAKSISAQEEAITQVHELMPSILNDGYLWPTAVKEDDLVFLQENFFLILFHSVFETLGCAPDRLRFYARLNLCIKGIVTAGDNLFDDEAKSLLPLQLRGGGRRFRAILEMLCFDRLLARICDDAAAEGTIPRGSRYPVLREILNRLAYVGALEGSEEEGVNGILPVEEMVDTVHRVRGGALFSIAFAAPSHIEQEAVLQRFARAEEAIRDLGTAFQIVDDLTDFEFDLTRRSHNLLVSAAYHSEEPEARKAIDELLNGADPQPAIVEGVFANCARRVLERAKHEGRMAFEKLADLGFWYPPEHSDDLVHAIVGIDGVMRMERLSS